MAIIARDAAGFHNERAVFSYSFDDSFSPPRITQFRLKNSSLGAAAAKPWAHFRLQRPDGSEIATFRHVHNSGAVMVIDVLATIGDLRMVGTRGKDQTIGYNLPFNVILGAA